MILRTAVELRLGALALRTVCTAPGDYANPIEPSVQGGFKIGTALSRIVGAIDSGDVTAARVWGGR